MIKHVDRGPLDREKLLEAPEASELTPGQGGGPVAVVELFTSEGCSSCPPADELLSEIVKEARDGRLPVFALGFHVDYWDFQGWPDRFATAANTVRQTIYAGRLGTGNLYTPQMVVNGVVEFVGSRRSAARTEITAALAQPSPTSVEVEVAWRASDDKALVVTYEVDAAPVGAVVNIAVVESGLEVKVEAGENVGWTLHHDNAVRAFTTTPLETERGQVELELPPDLDPTRASVTAYVQAGRIGRIVAATSADLPAAGR